MASPIKYGIDPKSIASLKLFRMLLSCVTSKRYPSDMTTGVSREVIISPPKPEPFIAHVSILIDTRAIPEINQASANFSRMRKSRRMFLQASPDFNIHCP